MEKYLFFIMLVLLTVVGCSTPPKPQREVIIEYTYITYELPKSLTSRCIPKKPMPSDQYSLLSEEAKQSYLTKYVIELLGEVKKCDNKVQGIKNYIEKQNALITDDGAIAKELL